MKIKLRNLFLSSFNIFVVGGVFTFVNLEAGCDKFKSIPCFTILSLKYKRKEYFNENTMRDATE